MGFEGGRRTIRPNVASGGMAGALMTLVLILYQASQGGELDEAGLTTIAGALTVVLQGLFAYFGPANQKTALSAAGGAVAVLLSILIAYFAGLPISQTALFDALVVLINVGFTAYVGNTKPPEPGLDPGGRVT